MESMAYDAILMRLRALYFKEVFHGEQAEMADANRICSTEFKMGCVLCGHFCNGHCDGCGKNPARFAGQMQFLRLHRRFMSRSFFQCAPRCL